MKDRSRHTRAFPKVKAAPHDWDRVRVHGRCISEPGYPFMDVRGVVGSSDWTHARNFPAHYLERSEEDSGQMIKVWPDDEGATDGKLWFDLADYRTHVDVIERGRVT